jgi:alkylation response protein AidB-like acyl-CoA dehydrogenase
MLLATEESRSLTYYAAWTADAEPESLPMAAAMAGARSADAGWQVPSSALQVFGGIGFTWEHDLQFWLKRGRVAGRMLGTPRDHRERVADLSGMGSGEPVPA